MDNDEDVSIFGSENFYNQSQNFYNGTFKRKLFQMYFRRSNDLCNRIVISTLISIINPYTIRVSSREQTLFGNPSSVLLVKYDRPVYL